MTDRQVGKTTFALREILGNRKEPFYFFSFNSDSAKYKRENFLKMFNLKDTKHTFLSGGNSFSDLRGVNLKYAVFDDYELFSQKFREHLMSRSAAMDIKEWYIFCSGNDKFVSGNQFEDVIKSVRKITTESNSWEEKVKEADKLDKQEKSFFYDVLSLKTTKIISDIKDYEQLGMLGKKFLAHQRIVNL
jgi:hypothetical protein